MKAQILVTASLMSLVLSGCCWHSASRPPLQEIVVESDKHHLGDGDGNEGVVFEKQFVVPEPLRERAILHLTFLSVCPNYESAPRIFINGLFAGSIQPFFPPLPGGSGDEERWQTNPDGTHDYKGDLPISLEVGRLLSAGTNTFKIQNGRADDDYHFGRVYLTLFD